jgi:hypothetical protein
VETEDGRDTECRDYLVRRKQQWALFDIITHILVSKKKLVLQTDTLLHEGIARCLDISHRAMERF